MINLLIALLILTVIIVAPFSFMLITATSEISFFRMCVRQKIWVSPIGLFLYRFRKIELRKVILPFMYLHEEGFPIDIRKIERLYIEGKDIQKVSLIMLWLNNLKVGENIEQIFETAYNLELCYKYEEDEIFIFNEKFSKMYLVNILSEKIEDKNLSMYIEFSSESDFKHVMEKTLQGFSLQGTLRIDVSKLLLQYDIKETAIEKIIENKENITAYLNQNINKERYAFNIETLSVRLMNLNEVADFLNIHFAEHIKKYNFAYLPFTLSDSDLENYLYVKNKTTNLKE